MLHLIYIYLYYQGRGWERRLLLVRVKLVAKPRPSQEFLGATPHAEILKTLYSTFPAISLSIESMHVHLLYFSKPTSQSATQTMFLDSLSMQCCSILDNFSPPLPLPLSPVISKTNVLPHL